MNITISKPLPTKVTEKIEPIINFTNALKPTFGSVKQGAALTETVRLTAPPPNRPKLITKRTSGNRLSEVNPKKISDPRLTSQVRASADTKAPPIKVPPVKVPPIVSPPAPPAKTA